SIPQITTVPVTYQTRLGALLSPPQRKTIPLPVGEKIILWLCPVFAVIFYFSIISFFQHLFPHALDTFFTVSPLVAFFLSLLGFGSMLIGPPVLLAFLTHNVF